MSCEYDYQKIKEPLDVFDGHSEKCMYFILWKTSKACPPLPDNLKTNKCSVKDKSGDVFNLKSLSHSSHLVKGNEGTAFYVSICKPVAYQYGQMCPPGSSICMQNTSATSLKERFVDFGQTVPDPEYENGQLLMKFSSNQTCPSSTKEKISSKMLFICAEKEQLPIYDGKYGCEHVFKWSTPLACSQKRSCSIVDEKTGKVFDFSSLSNRAYNLTHKGQNYIFGVCNMPKFDRYDDKSGALLMQPSQTVSLGVMNDVLRFNETGSPYLLYDSGSKCGTGFWSTKIEFICETDDVTYTPPKVVEDKDCQLLIQLETELACQKQISCTAFDNHMNEISLVPLMRNSSNYEALINETTIKGGNENKKYYLNVCRPLVPLYGLGCPGGSAACMGVKQGSLLEHEEGLGFPDVSLTAVGDRFQLKYLRGGKCEKDPETELSSVIEFFCDIKAGHGAPILQEIQHDCHYVFEWATNWICPAHTCEFRKEKCEIYNEQMDVAVNLKDVIGDGVLKVIMFSLSNF
jgi:insulin-like growth factor 2 receptor